MSSAQAQALEELRKGVDMRVAELAAEATNDGAHEPVSAAAPAAQEVEAEQGMAVDWSTEPTPAYANGLQLACSDQDYALLFTELTRFPGRLAPRNQVGQERARVAASLRVHPDVFFQMLCLMASSWNQCVSETADPRLRQPKFKLLDAGDMQLRGLSEKQRGGE